MRPNATLAIAALLLVAAPAAADVGPKITSGWFLPVGLTLGAGLHPEEEHGVVLGGEVSAAYLSVRDLMWWAGAYADVLYDFGTEATRFSVGPEVGLSVFGLDVGYLGVVDDQDGYASGLQVRGVVTIGFMAVYGRWGHVFGDVGEHDFGEVGLLIKAPIPLDVEPYRPGPPVEPYRPGPADAPPPQENEGPPAP